LSHKIMVVDDNSTTRRMVRIALQRNGHVVIEAADGETARRLMASERPRVVLQDLILPDANGFELVGELRGIARGTEVSILAFSGFVSELDEARVSNVGFDDIIAKPIAPSRLVPLIEAHLPSDSPARQDTERRTTDDAALLDAVLEGVLISRDVTANKHTEMHLMVADRMASVGTLAAGVAHEINNPLASVIANLDMALQDLAGVDPTRLPAELVDELRDARTAADRVREIVRDLKIFSRSEEDRRGPIDVEHVLDSTLRMAWNELRHRARIVKSYGHVPLVDANESRLGQVFLNLIINAAHAIPPGRYDSNQIRITTSLDARGHVVIAIADTGSGMAPEVRARLFTPFYTTKPVGVGTGLGLAISHKIVTQFGGAIAYDTEVGKGTEFRVVLPPAGGPAPVVARTTTNRAPARRRGRILIIDDEEKLASAIRRYLAKEHETVAVYRARDALELIARGERFDLIFCDLMMPQVTGMDLHAEVVRLDAAQAERIVFLTGGAFTASAREFLDQVPNRRLDKPFELKALRELVDELI